MKKLFLLSVLVLDWGSWDSVAEDPKTNFTSVINVAISFGGTNVFSIEELRGAAETALKSKGFEPITNGTCGINVSLAPKQTCTVIFVKSESGLTKKVQQVVFNERGKAIRIEAGPKEDQIRPRKAK